MKALTRFFREISRKKNIFWGLGIAFSVMVAAIGVFGFIFLSAFAIRNWFERYILESALTRSASSSLPGIPSAAQGSASPRNPLFDLFAAEKKKSIFSPASDGVAPVAPQDTLGYEIFYDLFSGNGWIDQGRTTLYQDRVMTSFVFPPKFSLERTSDSGVRFIGRAADGSDERCIGGRCLVVRGTSLSFAGSPLPLPESVRGGEVVNVSIGALEKLWTVGVTVKSGEDYLGWLFAFDGKGFKNIQREGKEIFVSRYSGAIGFGGTDGDWMAVYGAYEGRAVRVRDGVIDDLSRFFGIRVMAGGFDPEIIRIGSGNDITWFVWNKGGTPRLVKLFQNGTERVQGAVDLTSELGAELDGVSALQAAETADSHMLAIKIFRNGAWEYRRFIDEGFSSFSEGEIVSASLTNRILPVVLGSIARLEYADAGESPSFFLSNDNISWEETKIGDTVTFANQGGDKLFWKIKVPGPKNPYFSPYFGQIEVDYALKKGL